MTLKPLVGSVVGPTTRTRWGQVLHLPTAYGVVEISFPDGGARAKGIHLLSELSARLTDAPTSLNRLTDIARESAQEGIETILLCVPVGHVVYLALQGSGDVYLRRGQKFARLLHGSGSISGEIQPGDTIILASAEFSRALSMEEAAGVFDHLVPSEVAERLTLLLHEKPYGEGSAAMVLQFGEEIDIEETPPPKTMALPPTLLITAGLIGVFIIAVALGIWKQTTQGARPGVVAAVADARHAFDEGVALLTLNPVKGRERLTTAKRLLESLPASRDITDLLRQVNDNLTQSMQIVKVKPELFFDAALVKKGGTISSVGFEGTTMGIIDGATQTVLALDVISKKATVLGGGTTYGGMSGIAVHGDGVYVLTTGGIHKVRLTDKQTQQSVVKRDPQWGAIASLVSFGGNLYLLDTTKSRIWKYVATETGFTDTREYLNPDTLPDLSQTNSLAIDGSVWLGSTNGRLWKFTGGREDTFIPQGVDPAFGKNLVIYNSDAVNNIYVLDADNKRVVVLQKDGMYLAQYVWEDQLTPTQLAVSEGQKKIYLLAAGKIYAIILK